MGDDINFVRRDPFNTLRTFRHLPDDVVAIGLVVRSALGMPDDVCDTALPTFAHRGLLDPVGHVDYNADDYIAVPATVDGRVQRDAVDALAGMSGCDAAIAALWMLRATGPFRGCTPSSATLDVFRERLFAQHPTATPFHQLSAKGLSEEFAAIVAASDCAGAEVATLLSPRPLWMPGPALVVHPPALTPESFEVLRAFSGNPSLWKLFKHAARLITEPSNVDREVFDEVTLEDLRDAARGASEHEPSTVEIAATLAADAPGVHTVVAALEVAALVAARSAGLPAPARRAGLQ